MISPRWNKVIRDLWRNRARTVLVVLSVSVGVSALGAIINTQISLDRGLTDAWRAINPAAVAITTSEPFGQDLVDTVRRLRGVDEAEARRSLSVRVRTGPDEWHDATLFAVADYDDIRVNIIRPVSGPWPPPKRAVLIERSSMEFSPVGIGEVMHVRTPEGLERDLQVAGLVNDSSRPPAFIAESINGYITFDTLEWLGQSREYDELLVTVTGDPFDRRHVQEVAVRARDKVEKSGREVLSAVVPDPSRPPFGEYLEPMTILLGLLGTMSLLMSGFLVVNTVSAILRQQTRQIGVMKAVGGRTDQIAGIYLVMVLLIGGLSWLISVPAGIAAARLLVGMYAGLLNIDVQTSAVLPVVVAAQTLIALGAPALTTLYPVLKASRMSVRQAVTDQGLADSARRGLADRMLARVRVLPRPVTLSLRNTFRRRGRLALTLSALVIAGAMFVGVLTVRSGLMASVDESMAGLRYDLWVTLERPYRNSRLLNEVLSVPGVQSATPVGFTVIHRMRPDDTEGPEAVLMALPADQDLVKPKLLSGRWLLPGDRNAVVVANNALEQEPDLDVGDTMVFRIGGRETEWTIVGIAQLLFPYVYANYDEYQQVARETNRAGGLAVVTTQHDAATQTRVARALEARFEAAGLRMTSLSQMEKIREETRTGFDIIVLLLIVMAVLVSVVGALGLTGAIGIGVLERAREIGVMRAIGASNRAVMQVVLAEGIVIGLLSWAAAVLLAVPLGLMMTEAVGAGIVGSPLVFSYSVEGAFIWLIVVIAISLLAGILPARGAARITIREALSYEG